MSTNSYRSCSEEVQAYLLKLRFNQDHHLGLGDIRLSLGQQDEILEIINKHDGPPSKEQTVSESGEMARLKRELAIKSEFLSSRQCPDHAGKWERGRCLQCELEQARSATLQMPDDDRLVTLVFDCFRGDKERRALLRTRWKDSIDIEEPTHELREFVRNLLNKWIWREGEPPKDERAYLAFFPNYAGYVADQRFNIVHWSSWGGGVWDNISGYHMSSTPTHWMPLPTAPVDSFANSKEK